MAGRLEAPGVLLLFNIFYAVTGVRLYLGESLIIFDEAQQFPRARAAIKYLVADGRYLYVETGSLVSIREHVKDIVIPSEERHLRMYPMDFEEFMWAIGQELLYDEIVRHFQKGRPMGQALHRKAMDCFRQYLLVGGMPQVVQEYVSSHDFPAVDAVKRRILDLYRGDIHKHAVDYERKVEAIFDEIPEQLGRHEKRFFLSSLGGGARFREYESSFFWLDDSMIVTMRLTKR